MMHMVTPKKGRPREYTFQPIQAISDKNLAIAASMLRELRERVIDQVCDLPVEALIFHPLGTNLSIGTLVVHLVWAEAGWISTLAGGDEPSDLRKDTDDIGQAILAGLDPPSSMIPAFELVKLCKRIEVEVTIPELSSLEIGFDEVIKRRERMMTPRGVLMHLIWHWTYHSAHIGLLREQWGSNYTWTLGSLGE